MLRHFNMKGFKPREWFDVTHRRFVRTRPHFMKVYPGHNDAKIKVLMLLLWRKEVLKSDAGLTTKRISDQTGCNYDYLRSKAGKWAKWGYVNRLQGHLFGHIVYFYTIGKRGEHIIKDVCEPEWLTELAQQIREQQEWLAKHLEQVKERRRQQQENSPK